MDRTKPSPIALVVCDNVYHETGGKTALVGLFNRITTAQFPVRHARLCVYASVTSVRPGDDFRLVLVHSEGIHTVGVMNGKAPQNADPTSICDLIFDLKNVVFPEPGLYYVQFWGNDHLLLQRPFHVEQGKEKGAS